ncbi:MAG: DUF456 family protein [Betaproteobacteria bacterium]|nr:DUF456 family protein [Betaproteobacteria bacterium]
MGTETLLLWILAFALVAIGLAGTILPALPGVAFVFGGLLIAAWIGDFQKIGWPTLTLLGALMLMAMTIDFLAAMIGAKRVGASKYALIGAALGSVLGIFAGLIGIFIFPFVGAIAGEMIAHKNFQQATKVGFATWIGLLLGSVAKLALAITMIGVFLISYFF